MLPILSFIGDVIDIYELSDHSLFCLSSDFKV